MEINGTAIAQITAPAPIEVTSIGDQITVTAENAIGTAVQVIVTEKQVPLLILNFITSGDFGANQIYALPAAIVGASFPASGYPSQAVCSTAPTGDYVLTIVDLNNSTLATISFAASQKIGVFDWAGAAVGQGEALAIVTPGQDPSFAGANISLARTPD